MRAITVRDRDARVGGLTLTAMPYPRAAENDVIVRVHAAGFAPGELDWPGTWSDRAGRDRTPSIPGHELSGAVVELGYGTTGLTVGQRVFGLTDWTRNGSLAQYTAVEARNLAPLAADIDHTRAVPHRHGNAFVYAYVLEGAVRSQLEGEPMRTYHQGENWIEQPGAHHVATENASNTEPAELLLLLDAIGM
jgi:D-arabinose 1-dehydrogenase-like Zn-dependent alcohol dehydrogenase